MKVTEWPPIIPNREFKSPVLGHKRPYILIVFAKHRLTVLLWISTEDAVSHLIP